MNPARIPYQIKSASIKAHYYIRPANYTGRVSLLLILVFIAAGSCRSAEKNQKDLENLDSLAARKLGKENEVVLNASGDYALCQQKPVADHARRSFKYIVVRMSDNSIVREGYFNSGYVKWYNADAIEVYSFSGAGKDEPGSKKIIKVHSRQ